MRLAICDDDTRVLAAFGKMLARPEYAGTVDVSLFSSGEVLLEACRGNEFDMIFMDIMLGRSNGIEIAEKAAGMHPGVRIVFITAHVLDFAEKIFAGVRPYGYIGKPIDESKVNVYVRRAQRELEANGRELCVSLRGVEYRLLLSAVRYIESSGRQAYVHYGDEVIGGVYERLDVIAEQLDDRFVRCHQSFIVNLDYVSAMDADVFMVEDSGDGGDACSVPIRISRNRIKEARQRYFEYKGRTLL